MNYEQKVNLQNYMQGKLQNIKQEVYKKRQRFY